MHVVVTAMGHRCTCDNADGIVWGGHALRDHRAKVWGTGKYKAAVIWDWGVGTYVTVVTLGLLCSSHGASIQSVGKSGLATILESGMLAYTEPQSY